MEQQYKLNFMEFCGMLKKRLKLIIFITMAFTAAAGILNYFVLPPVYEGKTSVIIGKAPEQHNPAEEYSSNDNDIYMYQKLVKTYASIAKSDLVLDETAKLLGNGMTGTDIQNAAMVTPETDTQILQISCQSRTPEMAQKMANTLTEVFIEETQKIYPSDDIKFMDKAKLPTTPVRPRKLLNLTIAFLLGLMGSIGITFILEYMDNTIKTEKDVDKLLQLPVLGIIPLNEEKA